MWSDNTEATGGAAPNPISRIVSPLIGHCQQNTNSLYACRYDAKSIRSKFRYRTASLSKGETIDFRVYRAAINNRRERSAGTKIKRRDATGRISPLEGTDPSDGRQLDAISGQRDSSAVGSYVFNNPLNTAGRANGKRANVKAIRIELFDFPAVSACLPDSTARIRRSKPLEWSNA